MATKYTYKSLPATSQTIRLLHLQPAASDADELRASLVHADITEDPSPAYEALSYVWGDPVSPKTLQLNVDYGEPETHAITANLARCLISLRRPNTTRVLWVDAVCINQEDAHEKGRQIALMGKIYKTAVQVIIWLGEPAADALPPFFYPGFREELRRELVDGHVRSSALPYRDGKRFMFWCEKSTPAERDLPVAIHMTEAPPTAEMFVITPKSGSPMNFIMGPRSSSPLPPDVAPLDGFALVHRRATELLLKDDFGIEMQQVMLREGALFQQAAPFFDTVELERVFRYGIADVYTNP